MKGGLIRTIQRWILRHWPRHREKVMYLVVGAWNTLFAYGCFALLYYLLHEHLGPSVILVIATVLPSLNGYLTFRHLVFAPVRHPVIEYLRYQAVYLPIGVVNFVVLPLALKYSELNAYAIQALFGIFAVVAAYLGNKYFTFRKRRRRTEPNVAVDGPGDAAAPRAYSDDSDDLLPVDRSARME